MPHISRITKKNIILFGLISVLGAILLMFSANNSYLRNASALIHCAVIEAWAITVNGRIIEKSTRRFLTTISVILMILFLLRICRYDLFTGMPKVSRVLWYLNHVGFTLVPMVGVWFGLCMGAKKGDRPLKWAKYLAVVEAFLIVGILTNDLHHGMFLILSENAPNDGGYQQGWLWIVATIWEIALEAVLFYILIRKCRLSSSRKLWYVPSIPAAVGIVSMIFYAVHRGSPRIGTANLYSMSEMYAFSILITLECFIQIGLIPSNSDYGEIFQSSHLNAVLTDAQGHMVIRAGEILSRGDNDNLRICRQDISGGEIIWTEDLTTVNRLSEELEYAVEMIESENMLMEEENHSLEMRAKYETMNRLYDHIAFVLREPLSRLDEMLNREFREEKEFQECLDTCVVLGAYIKRRANLELLSEEKEKLPVGELSHAIKESFEYLTFSGCTGMVDTRGDAEVRAHILWLAYDLFEEVLENMPDTVSEIYVNIHAKEEFSMQLTLENAGSVLPDNWRIEEQKRLGVTIVSFVEEDILYIRLQERKEERS